MTNEWRPLLAGAAAAPYEEAIDAIVAALDSCETPPLDWGPAMLHAYLGVSRGSPASLQKSAALANRAADVMATQQLRPSLYAGLSGIGWSLSHIDAVCGRFDD